MAAAFHFLPLCGCGPGGAGAQGRGTAAADTWWIGRKHCVKGKHSLLLLSELRTAKRLVVVLGWREGNGVAGIGRG